MASYLTIYPLTLIGPLVFILTRSSGSRVPQIWSTVFLFLFSFCCLLSISHDILHSWDYLMDSYGYTLTVSDLTPNIGLFWYFFTEVFLHFREFFLFIFQYHVFLYFIPLTMRLNHHPVFIFWVLIATIAIFKSYPSVGDIALHLSLFPLFHHKLQEMKYGFIVAIAFVCVTILTPIIWRMWIYSGTGNANFYYALNLVLCVIQTILVTDALSAVMKRQFLLKKLTREYNAKKKDD
eukprot:TRINITY_DN2133_c0_g1_i2.p1 TRINITY_DN2133_c0_g1~~TRINITY_DN2133_c0_g1_i2.p1  ORF type:complete len:236 (+),score=1.23 TRINITY_DN2133_c0_g1_i2:97-804(+)